MMAKDLSAKWLKFIAHYSGDVKESAEAVGFNYSYARRKVTSDHRIMTAIRNRNVAETEEIVAERKEKVAHLIATREDRQQFWTDTMKDKTEGMNARLKASELLGKSEADFTEKVIEDTTLTVIRKSYDDRDA
jgi:hypothetical protein